MPQDESRNEPTLSARVGRRITQLRTSRGLSLSGLARMSGLSKSTLSELERGRRTATLDSLFAITTALTAPLSDLLTDESALLVTPENPDTVRGAAVTAILIDRSRTDTHVVEVFRISIGGNPQISEPHAEDVEEILTITAGTARIGPADAPITLHANESAHYPADVAHTYCSQDGATGILTMLYPAQV